MTVAVGDVRRVVSAASRLGGKVVLGGHSLGGGVVTAYATWSFGGRPGADGLSGLVYIDGGSFGHESAGTAQAALTALSAPGTSPWEAFGGIAAPFAGLYNATGSTAALIAPNAPSLGQQSGLLTPFHLTPSVPLTNLRAVRLRAQRGHLAARLWPPRRRIWAPGSRDRQAAGVERGRRADADHALCADVLGYRRHQRGRDRVVLPAAPQRRPRRHRQRHAERRRAGARLARHPRPPICPTACGSTRSGPALGGTTILGEARALALQSHIPLRQVTLVDRHASYAHNDPNGAYPHNAFFAHLIPFLDRIAAPHR